MGYFVDPLVMVLFGVVAFRERPRPLQWSAIGAVGVLVLVVAYGQVPWVALTLAGTFRTYALVEKRLGVGAIGAMTVETAVLFVPTVIYCVALQSTARRRSGTSHRCTPR